MGMSPTSRSLSLSSSIGCRDNEGEYEKTGMKDVNNMPKQMGFKRTTTSMPESPKPNTPDNSDSIPSTPVNKYSKGTTATATSSTCSRNGASRRRTTSLPVGRSSMYLFQRPSIEATTTMMMSPTNTIAAKTAYSKTKSISPKLKDRIAMFTTTTTNSSNSSSTLLLLSSQSLHGEDRSTSPSRFNTKKKKILDPLLLSLHEDNRSSSSSSSYFSSSTLSLQDRIAMFNESQRGSTNITNSSTRGDLSRGGSAGSNVLDAMLSPPNIRHYSDSILLESFGGGGLGGRSKLSMAWPPPMGIDSNRSSSFVRSHGSFDDLIDQELVKTGRSSFEPTISSISPNNKELSTISNMCKHKQQRLKNQNHFDKPYHDEEEQDDVDGEEEATETTTYCCEEHSSSINQNWNGQWGYDQGNESESSSFDFGQNQDQWATRMASTEEGGGDAAPLPESHLDSNWIYGNEPDDNSLQSGFGEEWGTSSSAGNVRKTQEINDAIIATKERQNNEDDEHVTGQWGFCTGGDDADEEENEESEWGDNERSYGDFVEDKIQDEPNQLQWVYGEGDTVDTKECSDGSFVADSFACDDGDAVVVDQNSEDLMYSPSYDGCAVDGVVDDDNNETDQPTGGSSRMKLCDEGGEVVVGDNDNSKATATYDHPNKHHPEFVSIKLHGAAEDLYVATRKRPQYRVRTKYMGTHNRAKDGIIRSMLK